MSFTLSHIPCPAGDNCTAFKCIFGHAKDKLVPEPPPATETAPKPPTLTEAASSDQDGPRKRLKTQVSSAVAARSGTDTARLPASSNLNSLKRQVSPPPVRRTTALAGSAIKRPHASSSTTTGSPKTQEQPKAKKAESLNPRLLRSAPASHEIRLRLLKMLHQEFKRLNTELGKGAKDELKKYIFSDQELIVRALDEEQVAAVEKPAVYSNVMKNKVMQYKRMKVAQWQTERTTEYESKNKKRTQSDVSDLPKKIETGLTSAQEVQLLNHLLTPIDHLSNHGYVVSVPSDEAIRSAMEGLEASKGWEKCDRCQQRFQVFPGRREEDGALTTGGKCNFHWGKTYVPVRNPTGERSWQTKRYQCCGQEVGDSVGCHTQDHHVYKVGDAKRLATVSNFANTPENALAATNRAVCFDCEMGYTVHGLELIRLTATSWPTGEELLDVLVRPVGEILDLNSRYSGVWPEDMAQAELWTAGDDLKPIKSGDETGSEDGELKTKKRLKVVPSPDVARDLLFSLISPATPLIGHGLENDLNAVRIVHPTVIDTVLLYPHKAGLPYRYGLKMLMDQQLNRKIQQETGPKMLGHDSAEDARAAGDLVRWKLLHKWKDMQRAGWRIIDGQILSPVQSGNTAGTLTEEFIEA